MTAHGPTTPGRPAGPGAPGVAAPRHSAAEVAAALDLHEPTPEQREVIEAPPVPLLVVAGAGAGKTETMSARVVQLVVDGVVSPAEVLGLTFTRKAAAELSDRVRLRLRQVRASGLWTPAEPPAGAGAEQDPAAAGPGAPAEAGLAAIDADRPTIATYNAFAGDLAAEHALRVGADPDARLVTDAGRWQIADRVVQGWRGPLRIDRAVSTITDAVLTLSDELDEHLLDVPQARELMGDLLDDLSGKAPEGRTKGPMSETKKVIPAVEARIALLDLVEAYRAACRDQGVIDFGGQVALATRVAREVPEVRAQARRRFRVVLLDEYQDTSVAQVALLAALYGDGHPVTAVGDPQQAIYGWRGASAGALEQFHDRFRSAGHHPRTLTLSTSWRNDEAVLAVANRIAGPLRVADTGAAETGQAVDAGRASVPGGAGPSTPAGSAPAPSSSASSGTAPGAPDPAGLVIPELVARPGAGPGEVLAAATLTSAEEAELVARFLTERWAPARGRTAAVLCRKRAQFTEIVDALEAAGLPVQVVGLGGLLAHRDVADLRALLTAVHDPARGDALVHLLTRAGLGAHDLHALNARALRIAEAEIAQAGDAPAGDAQADAALQAPPDAALRARDEAALGDAVADPPSAGPVPGSRFTFSAAAASRVERLRGAVGELRALSHVPLPEQVAHAERLLGLDIEAVARARHVSAGAARAALDAFTQVAVRYAADTPTATLGGFLAWLDAAEDKERGLPVPEAEVTTGDGAVQVLTVHAAKGLEWDVVAVPGLQEGSFPGHRSTPSKEPAVRASAWLTAISDLPYPLRGDADALPVLHAAAAETWKDLEEAVKEFRFAAGRHGVREERRLAYVAVTRARAHLLLSTSWYAGTAAKPRPASRFLREALGVGDVTVPDGWWRDEPDPEDADAAAGVLSATWPYDQLGARRGPVDTVAGEVERVLGMLADADRDPRPSDPRHTTEPWDAAAAEPAIVPDAPPSGTEDPDVRRWYTEAHLLLAEARRRAQGPGADVEEIQRASVSMLVQSLRSPDTAALDYRRPVPKRPSGAERRGTEVHSWIESQYRAPKLADPAFFDRGDTDDEDAKEPVLVGSDAEAALRRAFQGSEWAQRTPIALERAVSTVIDGTRIPCKIDAVFPEDTPDGPGVVVVDWKTGRPPAGAARRAQELQVQLYRLAWSRAAQLPLPRVRGAFVYLHDGVTHRVRDLTEEQIVDLARRGVAHLRGQQPDG